MVFVCPHAVHWLLYRAMCFGDAYGNVVFFSLLRTVMLPPGMGWESPHPSEGLCCNPHPLQFGVSYLDVFRPKSRKFFKVSMFQLSRILRKGLQ